MTYGIHRIEIERTGPEIADEEVIAFGKLDIGGANVIAVEFLLELLPAEREKLKELLDVVIARVKVGMRKQGLVKVAQYALTKKTRAQVSISLPLR